MKQLSLIKYYFIVFVLFANNLQSQDFKPTIVEIQSVFDSGNSESAEKLLLEKIKLLENTKTDPLLLSKHYNLLGEVYHNMYDIGIANKYWYKSYCLIKKTYGLNSVFIAENYSLLARYYSFRINVDSAFYFSEKALKMCRNKKDSLTFIPVNDIYREYAYNLKIKVEKIDFVKARENARLYFDSALYYNTKYFPKNIIFKARLDQDIGNTFTDEALYYSSVGKNISKARESFQKANLHYNNELSIYLTKWGNKNEKVANIYFVKALSYEYAFNRDSTLKCLEMLQKSLIALIPDFNNPDIFSSPISPFKFSNKAFATILLSYKTGEFSNLYDKTKDIKYLKYAYQHSIVESELWDFSIQHFNSFEIHQALNTYGAALQAKEIPLAEKYYLTTKNDSIKINLFKWIDLSKYATLLKHVSQNNFQHSINAVNISSIQTKMKNDECIINQYFYVGYYLCSYITKDKAEIMPSLNSKNITIKTDSLIYFLNKFDEKNYCKTAKWLYDSLLSKVLKKIPSNIKHLIIIPENQLAKIPYDALILNNCKSYQQADYLVNHYNISYGLSANLLLNSDTISKIQNSISFITGDFKKHTQLPFSSELQKGLMNNYSVFAANSIDTSKSNILHLATHAYCNTNESRNSYILFSDTDSLFLHDLIGKSLKYKLAIVSACETANGIVETGEGTINFNRSLFLAGIRNAITSLWKIDDKSSSAILKLFYSNLSNGETTSEALSNAKKEYLNKYKTIDDKNPYYWAGLIYTGNDLTIEKENNKKFIIYLLLSVGISFGVIVLFRKFRF